MEKRIAFLLDTNIWLERLLEQEKSNDVRVLLDMAPNNSFLMSDFTLHSIGVILFRLNKSGIFKKFIEDLFQSNFIKVISLNPLDQIDLVDISNKYKLDFDDSYQYQVAVKYDLSLVTFDRDFKKLKIKILTPAEAVQLLEK